MSLKDYILATKNSEQGLGLFETMLAALLLLLFAIPVIEFSNTQLAEYRVGILAKRLGVLEDAVSVHLDKADNWQNIYSKALASGYEKLDISKLEGVPQQFKEFGLPFGKTPNVYFRVPKTDVLEFIVFSSGGKVLNESLLSAASSNGRADFGYVAARKPDTLLDALGQYDLKTWNVGNVRPVSGNIGIYKTIPRNAVLSDFLYRNEVTSFPEANRMNTDLVMGNGTTNFDIRNVDALEAETMETQHNISVGGNIDVSGNLTVSGDIEGKNLDVNGTVKADTIDISSLLRTTNLTVSEDISANDITTETLEASTQVSATQAQISGNATSKALITETLSTETLESNQGSLGFIQGKTVQTDSLTTGDANVTKHLDTNTATITTQTTDTLYVDNCNGC